MKRRNVLAAAGSAGVVQVSGCAGLRSTTADVEVATMNTIAEKRTVSVVGTQHDEEVRRMNETIPGADPEGPAGSPETSGAFKGAEGERYTVGVTPQGRPTDTRDDDMTCADFDTEDGFAVWMTNRAENEDGKRTDLTTAACASR